MRVWHSDRTLPFNSLSTHQFSFSRHLSSSSRHLYLGPDSIHHVSTLFFRNSGPVRPQPRPGPFIRPAIAVLNILVLSTEYIYGKLLLHCHFTNPFDLDTFFLVYHCRSFDETDYAIGCRKEMNLAKAQAAWVFWFNLGTASRYWDKLIWLFVVACSSRGVR